LNTKSTIFQKSNGGFGTRKMLAKKDMEMVSYVLEVI